MSWFSAGEKQAKYTWRGKWRNRATAVVERGLIGGSCPNIACLLSKKVICSAKVAELHHRAAEFGLVTGKTSTDRHPELGDGYMSALVNFGFMANAALSTDEMVKAVG